MHKTLVMFLLCLAGALLNISLNKLSLIAGLPLYLDTVLTITITLLGGLFWGALCGTFTNLIGHSIWFWGWEGYLFILCNIATAFVTWLFICIFPRELSLAFRYSPSAAKTAQPVSAVFKSQRLGTLIDRMVVLILLAFSLCLAMSLLGGLLASLIHMIISSSADGLSVNPASESLSLIMFPQNLPVILVEILSRIPINIVDRLISAFGGYGIALVCVSFFANQQPSHNSRQGLLK